MSIEVLGRRRSLDPVLHILRNHDLKKSRKYGRQQNSNHRAHSVRKLRILENELETGSTLSFDLVFF